VELIFIGVPCGTPTFGTPKTSYILYTHYTTSSDNVNKYFSFPGIYFSGSLQDSRVLLVLVIAPSISQANYVPNYQIISIVIMPFHLDCRDAYLYNYLNVTGSMWNTVSVRVVLRLIAESFVRHFEMSRENVCGP
jgi:hypothetical protein